MKSILLLFGEFAGYLANISMFLPILASILVRIKKRKLSHEMKLFEGIIYLTVIAQFTSHSAAFGLIEYRNIILSIFLTIHLGFFSYLLLKWTNKFMSPIKISLGILLSTLVFNFIFSGYSFSADIMRWFNTFILLALAFYLSFSRDRNGVRLRNEQNFIHNGIYVSSLLTAFGIGLPKLDIIFFGFYLHTVATLTCNIYFARSFKCLYR